MSTNTERVQARPAPSRPNDIRLLEMNAIGRFSWKWPAATETFETGWVARVELNDQEFHVRHGIGRRVAYGRNRLRSVTWIENQPMVEGVEADDFPRSHCLMSLIKVTKRHLRWADRVPAGYRGLYGAAISSDIRASCSPRYPAGTRSAHRR